MGRRWGGSRCRRTHSMAPLTISWLVLPSDLDSDGMVRAGESPAPVRAASCCCDRVSIGNETQRVALAPGSRGTCRRPRARRGGLGQRGLCSSTLTTELAVPSSNGACRALLLRRRGGDQSSCCGRTKKPFRTPRPGHVRLTSARDATMRFPSSRTVPKKKLRL